MKAGWRLSRKRNDITKQIKNPPAQEAHFHESPKEVNQMKDVLDQLNRISEAFNPKKDVCKDKPNIQESGLAPHAQPFRPRHTQAPFPKIINLMCQHNVLQEHT
ncbi:hypothetical protein O181_046263 [Austropuccinia psidii MF-1]|uniref:Uncharacterized protein n=1 Tax=Austropuccinia psidii MF-1 TaxID=1389203 RepID=A0A9Q3DTP4_9BASI|nr:hypothetical protein [Austropuccinia psidii MF-1]